MKVCIHAGSVKVNCIYAGCSTHRSAYTQVSGCVSSVYVSYCDLAASAYCYSVLGSEFGILSLLLCSGYNFQRSVNLFVRLKRSFGYSKNFD